MLLLDSYFIYEKPRDFWLLLETYFYFSDMHLLFDYFFGLLNIDFF